MTIPEARVRCTPIRLVVIGGIGGIIVMAVLVLPNPEALFGETGLIEALLMMAITITNTGI